MGLSKFSFGQNLDSLWQVYKDKKRSDTSRLKAINEIAWSYANTNPDTAIVIAQQQLKLANTLPYNNVRYWIADGLNNIAYSYKAKSNFPKALEYYLKALKIIEETNNRMGIHIIYYNIGNVYLFQSDYKKALEYFTKSSIIAEEIKYAIGMADCYRNIGNIYSRQANYLKALKYLLKGLSVAEKSGYIPSIGYCYNDIGEIHRVQGNYTKALDYYFKALKINKEFKNNRSLATNYINLGLIYNSLTDYNKAIQFSDSALQICKKIGDIDGERYAYDNLATAYSKTGRYKLAFDCHVQFKTLSDSIFNKENNNLLGDIKTNFELEKKEAEIKAEQAIKDAVTTEQKQKQYIVLILISFLLILVAFFSVFMYRRFKIIQKQKLIIEQKEMDAQRQNIIISEQKHLVEEKQKEITDSINYAQRIQQAILPPMEFITQYLPTNFILFKPKDIVAGDFYWGENIGDLFFIAAADSTGHGVPGAMVSVVCSNALNRTLKEFKLTDPGKILDKTRDLVIETFEKSTSEVKDGMDISLLCIDYKNKSVLWSGANNSLWYIQDNELKEIKADKQPIGKTDYPKPFTTHKIEFKKNTTFYLFTDGFADQFGGPKGKKFKYKQFSDLLIKNNNLSLIQQAEIINNAFSYWKGDLEQVDDVCVIGIKI